MLKHKNEVLNDFWTIDNMKIIQRNDHFNYSIDSILLAGFITINKNIKNIVDLGTGNGSIPMLLSCRSSAKIEGIEIQESSVDLAKRNILLNNLENNINIIHGDINLYKTFFTHQSRDAVVVNPPFFKVDHTPGQINNIKHLSLARHEISIDLDKIMEASAYILKNRGYFAIVHRADRLIDVLESMRKQKLEPKRLQFCHSKVEKESKTILVEGIKGAKPGLIVLPPIFIHNNDGTYSDEVLNIFK